MLRPVLTALALVVIGVSTVVAQGVEPFAQSPVSSLPKSRFSGGVGVMTMPTDRLVAGFMMSLLYSSALSEHSELEFALSNHFGVQQSLFSQSLSPMPMPPSTQLMRNQYSWNYTTADATVFFTPPTSRFRVGGGASVQYRQQTYFVTNENLQGRNAYLSAHEGLMMGANLKADYLLPLTATLDLGFRAQAHGLFLYVSSNELYRLLPDVQLSGLVFFSARL
ncbi:MAG: hypothetical protein MUF71_02540 [Candidatus Kapabacteria bacterium]|nr:hypothetical protein [Candidatus Kapabacteria bacterium]